MRPDELLPASLAGRLRPWSGFDEEFVRATRTGNAAVVCNDLLARVFGESIEHLAVHDRDLALVAVRWITFGSELPVEVTCEACEARHDVTIDFDRLSRPSDAPNEIELFVDGATFAVRLPTAGDQAQILAYGDETSELRRLRLLAQCMRSPSTIDEVRALSEVVRAQIEAALESAIPDIDLELVLACPACGASIEAGVQLASIILAELRERSAHLLHDVHLLARTYHWSERDILAMSSPRRRDYLSLIDADHTATLLAEAVD